MAMRATTEEQPKPSREPFGTIEDFVEPFTPSDSSITTRKGTRIS